MKKLFVMLLSAVLAMSCVGCGGKRAQVEITTRPQEETVSAQETGAEDVLEGGWTAAEDPTITPELAGLCGKAVEGLVGAQYTPVALLATQVVAGTNYRILFCTAAVVPEAEETYAIGTIYEDLEGNATLEDVQATQVKTNLNELPGGWTAPESITLPEEARKAFDTVMEDLVGVDYQPLALLATQVAAGTNYAILCQATVVYPDAEPYYAIVYIAQGLEGQTEVMEIENLE